MADDNQAKESRSASFTAAQEAFNALTADEKLSFLMENMLSAAVGGVQKASDIFADAMEEAIRTARKACSDEGPAPSDRAEDAAPEASPEGDLGAASDPDSESGEPRAEG